MSEDSVTVMIQPTDDTETILEKVRTTDAQQINLIVPPETKALQTLGGFTMLRKACDITGINVTIYSADEKTCDMAQVCRFDVVRLDSEMPVRAALADEEEEPRIVVSTRPPEPTGETIAAAEERPAEIETRLEGLSEEDLALFDALESMSIDEDVELGEDTFARPSPIGATVEEPEVRVGRRVREPREREPRKESPLRKILDPITSALGNVYIAVVSLVLNIAARFQARQEAKEEPVVPADVGLTVRSEEEEREIRAQKQRYYLWTLVGVAAFTILLIALYVLSLPRAIVSLTPLEQEGREMDISLVVMMQDEVSKDAKVTTDGNGAVAIPAKTIQITMDGDASTKASGETWIAEGTATGAVIFTNRTEYVINVAAGTRISGAGATFHTTQDVVVPASDFWGSDAYVGIAQVGIAADQAGSAGNVDAWTVTAIEGDLAGVLNVINETGTSGGSERQSTIVTAEDQQELEQQLVVELQDEAYAELEKQLGSDLEVLEGTLEIETVEKTFSHPIGGEAETVVLTAKVRVSALASSRGLLDNAVRQAVEKELGSDKAGQKIDKPVYGAIEAVAPTGEPGVNAWTYRTRVRVSIRNIIDEDLKKEIRRELAGLTLEEAYKVLESYRGQIADYSISPVLDRMPSRLRIRVKETSSFLE
jgi:hypothetical protein